jgi:HEAT repeat protein/energy-coupling factor transporter ATP-binding protein EcfA2
MVPLPPPDLIGAISGSVFGYLLEQTGVAEQVRARLGLDPTRKAFERALSRAIARLQAEQPDGYANLFDASFFQHEGAPILAQFLLRDGHPDPVELAARWAESLALANPERRGVWTRSVEPLAAAFLDHLAHELKAEAELAQLHDSRALERLAEDLAALRASIGAARATPGTRRDYLRWLIDRNQYLDPRGTYQTQRQVQLRLDTIYVSLRAQRDDALTVVDRRLLEQELAELEQKLAGLRGEEAEDQREHLHALFQQRRGMAVVAPPEARDLAAVTAEHPFLAILGDPGSGKSTLLRYLALKHAEACRAGQPAAGELGPSRFPIFVRIADYAEHGLPKGLALSAFLADACRMHECPDSGVAELLQAELARGGCLLLIDGLDEIVDPDDRRTVVDQIDSFVQRHSGNENRFIVTSRVAGYKSAALGPLFAHYTVQEMDEVQIRTFLDRWCRAVEDAQTPDIAPELRQQVAQREIDAIVRAVQNPGVRRLAANPLLLRTLALIHRTGAQLPQRRIELYKLAADTLARTWRTAQGVPETALIRDEYLTPLLSRLAYWLHGTKATGIATEREVELVLGEEWAEINDLELDADRPSPAIVAEIRKFLLAVREHTGLFVERAPKRYGFMHLTFEEYYAARYLVASNKTRAGLIRRHLHDPRWNEPILLALGFVGLDSPKDATELLETAILAQGDEAAALGFTPSPHEELLGRDFRFALRCLQDDIPLRSRVLRPLITRLADESLRQTGLAQYTRYYQAVQACLERVYGSAAEALRSEIVPLLGDEDPEMRVTAARALGRLGQATPAVARVLHGALGDPDPRVRIAAAGALGWLGQATPEVVRALVGALGDADPLVRIAAARALGQLSQATPEVLRALCEALGDTEPQVRIEAARALGQLGQATPEVLRALRGALGDAEPRVRIEAARALAQLGQATPEVLRALLGALGHTEPLVRIVAARALGQLGQATPEVVRALLGALGDAEPRVRIEAARALGQSSEATPEVVRALLGALGDAEPRVRIEAARALGQLGQATPEAVRALLGALGDADPTVRIEAARVLGQLGQATPEVVRALRDALDDADPLVRYVCVGQLHALEHATPEMAPLAREGLAQAEGWSARVELARYLGDAGPADATTVEALRQGLLDTDNDVRTACAEALARIAQRFPASRQQIEQLFIQALADPAFAARDEIADRTGHDYAYHGLWLLFTNAEAG